MLSPFLFTDTALTEIYTLSLHDALPISCSLAHKLHRRDYYVLVLVHTLLRGRLGISGLISSKGKCYLLSDKLCYIDRKSTRLNSSHVEISYAVFCLKKKIKKKKSNKRNR